MSGREISDAGRSDLAPWRAEVLTLFPELYPGALDASLIGAAREVGHWSLRVHDIRDHGIGRHRDVDDRPAGGGAGMVLRADVLASAIDTVGATDLPRILLSPRGEPFSRDLAEELANGPGALFIAGRFEGYDQRVIDARQLREVSIGDYVLTGGDLPAMVMIDAIVRRRDGVLGNAESIADESFETPMLEHPHYTRPRIWEDRAIPDVLTSGDHARIARWRRDAARALTETRRPDLLVRTKSSSAERKP